MVTGVAAVHCGDLANAFVRNPADFPHERGTGRGVQPLANAAFTPTSSNFNRDWPASKGGALASPIAYS
jgi:hypothetical protein